MNKILFRYEIKKLTSQTSTKVLIAILLLFPLILVFGIVSPSDSFSITMDEFTASEFSNAILGFSFSLGTIYIIISVLSASIVSREIDTKYIYLMLSAVASPTRLYFYKAMAITLVVSITSLFSSILAYLSYSIFYLKDLTFSLNDFGTLAWGLLIITIICLMYMFIILIVNIITDGSIYASITVAIATIISLNILSSIKGVTPYLPAYAIDYDATRNNILLLIIYLSITAILALIVYSTARSKKFKS